MNATDLRLRAALCLLALGACSPSLGDDLTSASMGTGAASTGGDEAGTAEAPSTGEATSGEATAGEAPTSGGATGDAPLPCDDARTCPDGQVCFNGECARECDGDDDCPADQYCAGDGLCHDRDLGACPDTPCEGAQVCVDGYCSAPGGATCRPDAAGFDGCEPDALCYPGTDEGDDFECYTMPYCGEGDACPVGAVGAVCNVDLVANKDRICMLGACTGVEHCPADWRCVKVQAAVVGFCSSGAPGLPCLVDADCLSGTCVVAFPGVPGLCF